jgi:nucleoside-diphosphate-sugar epimerase
MAEARPGATLILGCGYTGRVLAQRLAFAGVPVFGTTRDPQAAGVIRTRGAEPVIWDGADLTPIRRLRGRFTHVICLVPPEMARDGSFADPTATLLEHLRQEHEVRAFVYVSSTGVWGDCGGASVTETTPVCPDSPRGRARVALETQVLASGLPTLVVRPAGIYGPGRSQLHRLAAGEYRLVGEGEAVSNRIHVDDLATLCEAALRRGTSGALYLASDLHPATQREVVDYLVECYGVPSPPRMSLEEARVRLEPNAFSMITGSKRLDPSWTLRSLGVTLRYPSFREGLEAVHRLEKDRLSRR